MSTEEKQNFQTYQDSDSVEYPENEKEVSSFIKKFYKSGAPIEIIGPSVNFVKNFKTVPPKYQDLLSKRTKEILTFLGYV